MQQRNKVMLSHNFTASTERPNLTLKVNDESTKDRIKFVNIIFLSVNPKTKQLVACFATASSFETS